MKLIVIARIASNISYLAYASLVEKILLYVLFVTMARRLGPESFGEFFLAFTFCNVIFMFNELGLTATVSRNVAIKKTVAEDYFGNFLGLRFVSTSLCLLLLLIITHYVDFSSKVDELVFLLAAYFFCSYLSHPFVAIFRAFEKMKYIFISTLVDRGFVTISGMFVVLVAGSLHSIALCFFGGSVLRLLIMSIFLKKGIIGRIAIKFELKVWSKLLKESLVIGVVMILSLVTLRADTLILSYYEFTEAIIGLFNAAQVLFTILLLPASSCIQGAFPFFSKMFDNNNRQKNEIVAVSYLFLLLITSIIAIVFYIMAEFVVLIVFGAEYKGSIEILKVLAIVVPFFSLNMLTQWLLISSNKGKGSLLLVAISTFLNILLNMIVIPDFGALGAAWTTVASQIITFIISAFFLIKIKHDMLIRV